jgi:O-antigen/teichoic acid export membrane protein
MIGGAQDGVAPDGGQIGATLRRYLAILSGDAGVAIFHFALNVKLMRLLDPVEYGVFGMLFLASGVLAMYVGAFASVPLTVHVPKAGGGRRAAYLEVVFGAVALVVTALAALLVALLAHALAGGWRLPAAAAAFTAALCLRYHVRSLFYARRRGADPGAADMLYVGVGAALLAAWAFLFDRPIDGATVFAVLALSGSASACFLLFGRLARRRLSFRRSVLRRVRKLAPELWWGAAQVTVFNLQSQALVILVGAMAGPAAYAPFHAGFVLLSALRTLSVSWSSTIRPEFAALIGAGDRDAAVAKLAQASVFGAGVMAVFAAGLFAAWPLVDRLLFAQQFASEPMRLILALQWLATLTYLTRENVDQLVRAESDMYALFASRLIGAAVGFASIWALLAAAPLPWAVLGVVASEAATLLYLVARVRRPAR